MNALDCLNILGSMRLHESYLNLTLDKHQRLLLSYQKLPENKGYTTSSLYRTLKTSNPTSLIALKTEKRLIHSFIKINENDKGRYNDIVNKKLINGLFKEPQDISSPVPPKI